MNEKIARQLLPLGALIPAGIVVAVCYFFVDRQVARFVHDHRFFPDWLWTSAPMVSGWFGTLTVAGIAAVIAWRLWRPGGDSQRLLLVIAANIVATVAVKCLLKWVFGRSWPETWIDNNPSFIADGVYGFHPFCGGSAYESFPSGHASFTFAVISILWLSRPRWRWPLLFVGVALAAALVVLNYHFVGDVVAGATLGCLTGLYAVRIGGVKRGASSMTACNSVLGTH